MLDFAEPHLLVLILVPEPVLAPHAPVTYNLGRGYSTLEFAMNIELEEAVVQDVSDDVLELAAGSRTAYAKVSWLNLQTHCAA